MKPHKLPSDVRSLWWSGRLWYAASVEPKERGRNAGDPKYHGIGMTKHNAVWAMRLEALKQSERVKVLTEQGKRATASLQASHVENIQHIGALYGKELQNDQKTIANYRSQLSNKLREQSESSAVRLSSNDENRPTENHSNGVSFAESKNCTTERDYIRTLEEAGAVCAADYNICYDYVKQEQDRIGVISFQ